MLEIFGGRLIPSSSGAFVHSLRDVPVRRPLRPNTEVAKDAPTQILEAHLAQAGPDVVLALRAPGAAEPRTHRADGRKAQLSSAWPRLHQHTTCPNAGGNGAGLPRQSATPIFLDTV